MGKSARALWAEKLAKAQCADAKTGVVSLKKSDLKLAKSSPALTPVSFEGTVIGIDPSLRGTGLAVVRMRQGQRPEFLASMRVTNSPKMSQAECLGAIFRAVDSLACKFETTCAAVEQSIYVQNNQTALILGSARGAAIAAAANFEMPVFEYPPLRIKQAVVGFGRASKEQVSRTVAAILRIKPLGFDESDAAAAALAHIFTYKDYL
ncbi:MAG: crossover junction endodeoxyribonuclease RuvC [Opitutales bacterium]|nr:crossover junction endodeoxyribonuclease RuvC [Opitutales bacterium]